MINKHRNNLVTFFNYPYGLLNDSRVKIILSVGLPFFILFFLWIFGPFGLVLFDDLVRFRLLTVISIAGAVIIAIHVYLLQNLIIKNYTIGSTAIWLVWITLLIGLSNFFIYEFYFKSSYLHWNDLPFMLYQTFLIGLLPYLFVFILYNTYYLKNRIKVINQINTSLTSYKSNIKTPEVLLTLTSFNLREVVTIGSNALLYIVSSDNYVELNWFEEGRIKKSMLRNTLADTEKEIKKQVSHIQRCHNSYIVNINQIKTVSGNSGGYRITLNNTDYTIPISRKYKDGLLKLLAGSSL